MRHKTPILWTMILCAMIFMFALWTQLAFADSIPSVRTLPIFENFDNGAPTWLGYGWSLSEEYRFGPSGLGWGAADIEYDNSYKALRWHDTIDLTGTTKPRLRFNYKVTAGLRDARVDVYKNRYTYAIPLNLIAGGWRQIDVDLSSYRGSTIQLSWIWVSQGQTGASVMIDNVRLDDVASVPTATSIVPTVPSVITMTVPPPTRTQMPIVITRTATP